jgi:hypothetical protein
MDWPIACFLTYNRNLACSEGTRLDYCDVVSATGDFSMAIILLGRLYFMLPCWLNPTEAPFVQYGGCVGRRATYSLTRPHLSLGVSFEVLWVRLLVSFWCEDTYQVEGPD